VLIDCDRCEMRDIACDDCVVGALITQQDLPGPREPRAADQPAEAQGTGRPGPEIGEPERRALRTLASAGLVPPLRLVLPDPAPPQGSPPQGSPPQGSPPQGRAPQRSARRDPEVPDAEAS
jgi:hypothetical protein